MKGEQWWVMMDFAGDHTVRTGDPDWDLAEYEGPFSSFTAMRLRILEAGQNEIQEIQNLQRVWRAKTKQEVIDYEDQGY